MITLEIAILLVILVPLVSSATYIVHCQNKISIGFKCGLDKILEEYNIKIEKSKQNTRYRVTMYNVGTVKVGPITLHKTLKECEKKNPMNVFKELIDKKSVKGYDINTKYYWDARG